MTDFLRRFRAAWAYTAFQPYIEAADHEDFWNKEDSKTVEHFMNSPTGQKLRARMRNFMFKSAVHATQPGDNPVHRAGKAFGVAATFSWIDSHLPEAPEQVSQPAENDWMERLRP